MKRSTCAGGGAHPTLTFRNQLMRADETTREAEPCSTLPHAWDRLWNLARAATLLWQDENLIPSPEETSHGETCLCFNPVGVHELRRERAGVPLASTNTATCAWIGPPFSVIGFRVLVLVLLPLQ